MEGQASIGDMFRFSWAKSREILFPFNFKRWFKIMIIVWLAGVGVQGCSSNFGDFGKLGTSSPMVDVSRPLLTVTSTTSTSAAGSGMSVPAQVPTSAEMPSQEGKRTQPPASVPSPKVDFRKWAVFVVPAILLGLVLMLVFMWMGSRFNFILLDVIVTKNVAIKEQFRENRELGNSFFKWGLAFVGASLGFLLVIGLITVALIATFKGNVLWAGLSGVLGGLVIIAALFAMGIVGLGAHHFVTAIMYREKIPAMSALYQFFRTGTFTFEKVFQYLLVILGLSILASIVQGLVSLLLAMGGLIAGVIAALPGIFLIKALPILKLPLIILGGLAAMVLILAVIVVIGMVMLPVAIFFRVFALTYLTRFYPECDLMGFTVNK